jgi:hypothetical protein
MEEGRIDAADVHEDVSQPRLRELVKLDVTPAPVGDTATNAQGSWVCWARYLKLGASCSGC